MFEVRVLPHPLPSPKGGDVCSSAAAAVRQPGYLLQASSKGLLGFAPSLRSEFAFIATPQRQRLCERSYQLGSLQSIGPMPFSKSLGRLEHFSRWLIGQPVTTVRKPARSVPLADGIERLRYGFHQGLLRASLDAA